MPFELIKKTNYKKKKTAIAARVSPRRHLREVNDRRKKARRTRPQVSVGETTEENLLHRMFLVWCFRDLLIQAVAVT